LTLVLAIGIFFRLYMIKQMPAGLFPDEAAEGLDAQNINKGFFQPFYERGNGREALFYYLMAPIIKIFGAGFWQPHLLSALIGILSVLGVYLLAAKLYGQKTGLLAAFLMAVGTWHIVLSRTGFRANLIPLFLTMTVYFTVRAVQTKNKTDRLWSSILAGAFFAGGFYSYIAYRILVAILGFIGFLLLMADRRQSFLWMKKYYQSILIALVAFVIVFAPLGYYFISHPGSFVGRSSQVSVFNAELNHGHLGATIVDVTKKSVLAFFTHGDLNWRHNISGAPFLSPLVSPFFAIGLIWLTWLTLKFIWQSFSNTQNNDDIKHVLIIGLFYGMLLPVITTAEGIPHGLRSIGMVPSAYILSAIGLMYFARWALKVWHHEWMEKVYWLVAISYFATLIFVSYTTYFVFASYSFQNYQAFRGDLSGVSDYINQNPQKDKNLLVLDLFSVQTVEYLTADTNHPYVIVDPENSYKLNVAAGQRIIFTNSTLFDTVKFTQAHKNLKLKIVDNLKLGTTDYAVYEAQVSDKSQSLSFNSDDSFWALNLGDKIYFSWENQSLRKWHIKIWNCGDKNCITSLLIKDNQQNDYFSNTDHIDTDGKKSDLYYKAVGFDSNDKVIKDFGVIKVNQYK
jgi:4-amino-4-deoxy-L-arabinose transferase-like glycosyltransferase